MINAELEATIVAEIPAFSDSQNPDTLPELGRHIPQHTTKIIQILDSKSVGELTFVRTYAQQRAEQYFPLEATTACVSMCS